MRETQIQSQGQEDPQRRERLLTPVFLHREFHGLRSLVGYSTCGCKELDTTEQLTHTHTHTLLPVSQVIVGKPVNLSKHQFPHLLNEDNGSTPPVGSLGG